MGKNSREMMNGAPAGPIDPGDKPAFAEKVYLVVAKIIPDAWLATAFVAAAGAALLFFILMIVGFATGGDAPSVPLPEGTDAELAVQVQSLQIELEEVKKARDEALSAAGDRPSADDGDDDGAELAAHREAAEKAQDQLKEQIQELKRQLATAKAKASAVPVVAAGDDRGKITRERDAAKLEAESHKKQITQLVYELSRLRKENEALEKRLPKVTDAGAAVTKTAAGVPATSSAASKASAQAKMTDKEAKKLYSEAMGKLKKAKTHDDGIALLEAAKRKVAGTPYEARLAATIKERNADKADEDARAVYKEALARIAKAPEAHVANLGALNLALAKVAGTRYERALSRLVQARQKSLKDDIGLAVYDDARERLKKSPKDHAGNLDHLGACKAKAAGSRYEASIEKLIEREKAALEKQTRADAKK